MTVETPTRGYEQAIAQYKKGIKDIERARDQSNSAREAIKANFYPAIDEVLQSQGKQVCSIDVHPNETTDERKMGIFPVEELGIYDPQGVYEMGEGLELKCKAHGKENVSFRIIKGETRIFNPKGEDVTEKPLWRQRPRYVKIADYLGLPALPGSADIFFSGVYHDFTPHKLTELPRVYEPNLGLKEVLSL